MDDHPLIEDFRIAELRIGFAVTETPFCIALPDGRVAECRGGVWPILEIVYTGGYFRYWASMQ